MGRFIQFDQKQYMREVQKAITVQLLLMEPIILQNLNNSFDTLQLRKTDAKYRTIMQESIRSSIVESATRFVASFGAGGEVSKDEPSFLVVYYEYGSKQMKNSSTYQLAGSLGRDDWNMARKGRDVYVRSSGSWVDREAYAAPLGRARQSTKQNQTKPFGEEILAQFWFRRVMLESILMFYDAVRAAVKKVPPGSYIKLRDMTKRM
ncbi:hypothetical protein [Paenibacillus arenosi]|uniref:Uncharacterized protein n=1 Tax=Paenibacillus arenosi TaxID=2774142 RepID=A0ABR9AXM7_9BACL|nr:hypothetical protein [Paenibacillus arenosi]MBD8498895.1 hypothetical protein [Paenibacillus arenosi]